MEKFYVSFFSTRLVAQPFRTVIIEADDMISAYKVMHRKLSGWFPFMQFDGALIRRRAVDWITIESKKRLDEMLEMAATKNKGSGN